MSVYDDMAAHAGYQGEQAREVAMRLEQEEMDKAMEAAYFAAYFAALEEQANADLQAAFENDLQDEGTSVIGGGR